MKRFLLGTISFFFCIIPLVQKHSRDNQLVDLTYLIICLIAVIGIFRRNYFSFSFYKIFYTFVLFFFGIAPYVQFSNNTVFWQRGVKFSDNDYLFTNILIIVILFVFEVIYYNVFKYSFRKISINKRFTERNNLEIKFLFLTLLSSIIVLNSVDFNIVALLLRGGEIIEKQQVFNSFYLIINNFFRPLPILIFMVYYNLKKWNFFTLIYFVIGLLCAFPTGIPRFSAAAIYIPMFLLFFPKMRVKYYFNIILVFGLLVMFPFLNNFRDVNNQSDINKFELGFNFKMFNEGHFDSYSSLLRIVKYDIVTWGNQLLGVILFWVPRSVWPGKPVGSGVYMADLINLDFSNISCNYFAEGYINFGYLGIFLFVLAFALFCGVYDKKYYELERNNKLYTFQLKYFLLSGFLIFLLRGDLLSSFAYLCGFMAAYTLIIKIVYKDEK